MSVLGKGKKTSACHAITHDAITEPAVTHDAIAHNAVAEPAVAHDAVAEPTIAHDAVTEPAHDAEKRTSAAAGIRKTKRTSNANAVADSAASAET
ncbi:hypothetical protein ACTID9_11635 [Brevibacillus fluminis]|uniref:hypothetical protein n=1 Tax=Brevibacillus fluminis TaxID=511487 RepID=UPI003F88DCE1